MLFQAYSQDAVAEMRDVMEKGGMDSLATRGPPKAPAVSCSKYCIFFASSPLIIHTTMTFEMARLTSLTPARVMPSWWSTWRSEANRRHLNLGDVERASVKQSIYMLVISINQDQHKKSGSKLGPGPSNYIWGQVHWFLSPLCPFLF